MKSKILTSVIITVIFALLSVTTLFTIVSNIQEINRTKESLKNLNNYIVENNIYDNDLIELYNKTHFIKDTLEKMLRLSRILEFLNNDEFFKDK